MYKPGDTVYIVSTSLKAPQRLVNTRGTVTFVNDGAFAVVGENETIYFYFLAKDLRLIKHTPLQRRCRFCPSRR